jgi:hypothetical protein
VELFGVICSLPVSRFDLPLNESAQWIDIVLDAQVRP